MPGYYHEGSLVKQNLMIPHCIPAVGFLWAIFFDWNG